MSSGAEKAVASFFTPISKKDPEPITWRIVEQSLLVGKYCPRTYPKDIDEPSAKRRKVAAFDFVRFQPVLSGLRHPSANSLRIQL